MSWSDFIDSVYAWCVKVLMAGAEFIGITYKEINIFIFCVIGPIVFVLMAVTIVYQWLKIKKLKKQSVT